MKLVMIHGRSQGGKNPDKLKDEWLDALAYGLERTGRKLPAATDVRFPFYGDLLDRLVVQANVPLTSEIRAKGALPEDENAFRGEFLQEIAYASGLTEEDIARELRGMPVEKGPLNWAWVQAILSAMEKVPGLNSRIVDTFTRDVYVYLTYPAVRRQIDAMVAAEIGDGDCVVLAHSLGSIVAYNVLYARSASTRCRRLVTVGSPLGLTVVKKYIERPLRSPPCVAHWFNAYDDRDVVALIPLDGVNFGVVPPIEGKSDVVNFTDNRHGIAGYLADPIVTARIAEFL